MFKEKKEERVKETEVNNEKERVKKREHKNRYVPQVGQLLEKKRTVLQEVAVVMKSPTIILYAFSDPIVQHPGCDG